VRENNSLRLLNGASSVSPAGALWHDIKFDAKHFNDIERIAMVGETKWQHGMSVFCKPFTAAKLRYYDHSAIEEARDWLSGN